MQRKHTSPTRIWKHPDDTKKTRKWVRRVAYRREGALAMAFLATVHERMGLGVMQRAGGILNIPFSRYITGRPDTPFKRPRDISEGATLLEAIEKLVRGKCRALADLLVSRLKAVEKRCLKGGDWGEAEKLEIRTDIAGSLSESTIR